jgi:low affinity Fe/Cu permease
MKTIPKPEKDEGSKVGGWFRLFANKTSHIVGSPWSFLSAVLIVVIWGALGPVFGFSDTWQLVINTSTTIITFLMVFLIQNTQNRDAKGIHLKLDELIHALKGARNQLIDLEDLSDEELKELEQQFKRVSKVANRPVSNRGQSDSMPEE